MKEAYISPELRLLSFAPAQSLASGVEMDDVLGGGSSSGSVSNVLPDIGDVDVEIGL